MNKEMSWSEAFRKKDELLATLKKEYSANRMMGLLSMDPAVDAKIIKLFDDAEVNKIKPAEFFSGWQSIATAWLNNQTSMVEKLDEIINR